MLYRLLFIVFFIISCNKNPSSSSDNLCTNTCFNGEVVCDPNQCFEFIPPEWWDCDNDGVLDNYNDYQNNGSITAAVLVDGENLVSEGDLFAAFVDDEQRGSGAVTLVPFGPYQGTYQFLTLIYSNSPSGETITYKFYDSETGNVYDILEITPFITDMILGDVTNPEIFNVSVSNISNIYLQCYISCSGITIGDCIEECVDDDDATINLGGCIPAVEALGCDFTFDASLISELCPFTCEECEE